MKMKTFYITFGGIFLGYHLTLEAYSEDIARAWIGKETNGKWSNIYTTEPTRSKPLHPTSTQLFYSRPEDIQ